MNTQKKLSLAPLSFNEAVADILKVKPEPKPGKAPAKRPRIAPNAKQGKHA
jgi:hypothetical protein